MRQAANIIVYFFQYMYKWKQVTNRLTWEYNISQIGPISHSTKGSELYAQV